MVLSVISETTPTGVRADPHGENWIILVMIRKGGVNEHAP